jgi:hypothetical protein
MTTSGWLSPSFIDAGWCSGKHAVSFHLAGCGRACRQGAVAHPPLEQRRHGLGVAEGTLEPACSPARSGKLFTNHTGTRHPSRTEVCVSEVPSISSSSTQEPTCGQRLCRESGDSTRKSSGRNPCPHPSNRPGVTCRNGAKRPCPSHQRVAVVHVRLSLSLSLAVSDSPRTGLQGCIGGRPPLWPPPLLLQALGRNCGKGQGSKWEKTPIRSHRPDCMRLCPSRPGSGRPALL